MSEEEIDLDWIWDGLELIRDRMESGEFIKAFRTVKRLIRHFEDYGDYQEYYGEKADSEFEDECRVCGKPRENMERAIPTVSGGCGLKWGGLTGEIICEECFDDSKQN